MNPIAEMKALRAENDHLKKLVTILTNELEDIDRENKKLRAVVEAAEKCIVDETMPFYEAKEIIKTWRGEPGYDANGSPV